MYLGIVWVGVCVKGGSFIRSEQNGEEKEWLSRSHPHMAAESIDIKDGQDRSYSSCLIALSLKARGSRLAVLCVACSGVDAG